MITELHTGNKRMHQWLYQPGQIALDQYRVSGDGGEVAEVVAAQTMFMITTGQLMNNL